MIDNEFLAERISETAKILLKENIFTIFPLFNPIEEKKWSFKWKPHIIYPPDERIEKGMVFRVKENVPDEFFSNWIISNYNEDEYLIEYTVSTINRIWIIFIKCNPVTDKQTEAIITYTYTGLNDKGNTLNKQAIEKIFKHNLKDWENAINIYLETGSLLKR